MAHHRAMRKVVFVLVLATLNFSCSKGNRLRGFEGAITMHTTSASATSDMVVEVKKDRLRFDTKTPQGDAMHGVFDPATNKVTVYLDASKSYMDLDFTKPEAQTNTSPDTSAVVKSGRHETIAGYDCEDWTVNDPSGKKSEVCIAQGLAFFDLSSLKGGGGASSPLARQFRDEKSFPLRSVELDASGKELSRMEVTKIEPKSIDDSQFQAPPGYSKVTVPGH